VHSIFLGAGPDQVVIEKVNLLGLELGNYQVIALTIRLTRLKTARHASFWGKSENRNVPFGEERNDNSVLL